MKILSGQKTQEAEMNFLMEALIMRSVRLVYDFYRAMLRRARL